MAVKRMDRIFALGEVALFWFIHENFPASKRKVIIDSLLAGNDYVFETSDQVFELTLYPEPEGESYFHQFALDPMVLSKLQKSRAPQSKNSSRSVQ